MAKSNPFGKEAKAEHESMKHEKGEHENAKKHKFGKPAKGQKAKKGIK